MKVFVDVETEADQNKMESLSKSLEEAKSEIQELKKQLMRRII